MRKLTLAAVAMAACSSAPLMAQAAGEASAVVAPACDHDCLIGKVEQYVAALRAGDASQLHTTGDVRYSENDVLVPLGKGLWSTVTDVDKTGLEAADPLTGNAAWFGSVRENGKPAIYAVRVHVSHGLIDEIESIVVRKTALPSPFGDVEHMAHDPEFNQILPPEQRRPRERMLSIADGYFSTVELNDGQVLTQFTDDCGRLENGISTTAPRTGPGGNAATIATGCENQFKLGIYRINKRVRRDFFIIDEERGVAVGRGFFDHANEFDHYKLTDGREMKTALKWPNSISLLEAFRIRDGKISRIEAVFSYVPYFMPNPFRDGVSVPPDYAPQPAVCGDACLDADARSVMKAMVNNQWRSVNWADTVGYGENSVGVRVGEGTWASVTAIDDKPLVIADGETGKAVWIGRIEDHGQPAWAAVTVTADGKQVGGVEALYRRKEFGAPYVEPTGAPQFGELPKAQRTSREAMLKVVDGVYDGLNAHTTDAPPGLGDNCQWTVNGQGMGTCSSPFTSNAFRVIEQFRDRRVLAVDEARGLVAVEGFEDWPGAPPHSVQVVEVFRFVNGKVEQIAGYTAELPYGMKPHR